MRSWHKRSSYFVCCKYASCSSRSTRRRPPCCSPSGITTRRWKIRQKSRKQRKWTPMTSHRATPSDTKLQSVPNVDNFFANNFEIIQLKIPWIRDVRPRGLASASRPKNLASASASASASWVVASASASASWVLASASWVLASSLEASRGQPPKRNGMWLE